MDTLLNAPILLVILVAVIGIALLFTGLRNGRPPFRRAGYGFLIAALLLELSALFLPTDAKRVEHKARALMAAISAADWNAVGPMLKRASMYTWKGDDLAKAAHDNAEHYGLIDIRVNSVTVTKEPMAITARVSVTTHHRGQWVDTVPSTWDLEYQKRGTEWMLIQVIPIQIGNMSQSGDKESLLRGYVK